MYGTLAHTLLLSLCCLASKKASEINMKRLTTDEYKNTLKDIGASVEPIEEYILSPTPINHKCLDCENIVKIAPNKVIEYTKKHLCICQKCSGMRLYVGKNDLWTTDPDIARMLKNPEESRGRLSIN